MRLTEGADWESEVVALGSCTPFRSLYEPESPLLLKRTSIPLQLFGPKITNFLLRIECGLQMDDRVVPPACSMHKVNEVYFPPDAFYSCNKLPPEWLEVLL